MLRDPALAVDQPVASSRRSTTSATRPAAGSGTRSAGSPSPPGPPSSRPRRTWRSARTRRPRPRSSRGSGARARSSGDGGRAPAPRRAPRAVSGTACADGTARSRAEATSGSVSADGEVLHLAGASRSPSRRRSRPRALPASSTPMARPRTRRPSRRVASTSRPIVARHVGPRSAAPAGTSDVRLVEATNVGGTPSAAPRDRRRRSRPRPRRPPAARGSRRSRRPRARAVRRPPTTPRGCRPTFASPISRSFGHLHRTSTPATSRIAPAIAAPASERDAGRRARGSSVGRSTNENMRARPGSVRPTSGPGVRARRSGARRPRGSTRVPRPRPSPSAVAFVEPVTSSKRTGASRPTAASARSSSVTDSIRLTPSEASPIIASQPWRRNRRS